MADQRNPQHGGNSDCHVTLMTYVIVLLIIFVYYADGKPQLQSWQREE